MENSKYSRLIAISIIAAAILSIILIIIPILLSIVPELSDIFKKGGAAQASVYIKSFGFAGTIILFLIQVLQSISIVLPGPPIWTVAGVTYGIWIGAIICILGMLLGGIISFFIAKKVGNRLIDIIIGKKKLKFLKFLENKERSIVVIFMLYILPLFPTPLVPYLAARADISFKKFGLILVIANIPSVLYFTLAGDQIIKGNFIVTIIQTVFLVVFGLLFFIFRKKIMNFAEKILR